ncbi:hypothetical protein J6590_058933 [Homalodisca vitripennis]|nr:hypothetical protein J6590_058933 [Homalodisca vitripennis]
MAQKGRQIKGSRSVIAVFSRADYTRGANACALGGMEGRVSRREGQGQSYRYPPGGSEKEIALWGGERAQSSPSRHRKALTHRLHSCYRSPLTLPVRSPPLA